jgi:hypothetical protein
MVGGNDLAQYDDEALKATFQDTRQSVEHMRQELFRRGFWVDQKYIISEISSLNDDHLIAIIRMLKNNAVRKSRSWRGLRDKTWQAFICEHSAYPSLYNEAQTRNLPGASILPDYRQTNGRAR